MNHTAHRRVPLKLVNTIWTIGLALSLLVGLPQPTIAASQQAAAAFERLSSAHPGIMAYEEGGKIVRIYGSAFGGGSSVENAAAAFVAEHAGVFGARYDDLTSGSLLRDGRATQPAMPDRQAGGFKFTIAYYTQHRGGVPVFGSDLRILVKNTAGFPIVLAASALRELGDFVPGSPDPSAHDLGKQSVHADHSSLVEFTEPKTVIWAGINDESVRPVLALVFEGSNDSPEKWLFVTDAKTGAVLYEENQLIFEDVTGNVSGYATEGSGAEQCEDEPLTAMPYARVNIGPAFSYSDINGDFVISNPGTSLVTVQSPVRGQYFWVYNSAGASTVLMQSVMPPGPANFVHNPANTEQTRAEVNGYIQSNVVRDFTLAHNPSYPVVSTQVEFPVYVNRNDGYCPGNAWYDQIEQSLNFCLAASGYPNTAWSSVIHHEYGHHLVEMAGSGQDQYGEGMGDVMSVIILDDSQLGLGFFGSCSQALRTADNTMQYPCSDEAHACAPLLSGCVWSTRNELVVTNPSTYREILGDLAVNSILLHTGSTITPQITIDWLTLDDDDANLNNGTPHHAEICAGFGAHNMDCPELVYISFSYPEGRPELMDPYQPTGFKVVANPGASSPVQGTGTLHYSVDGGAFQNFPMTELVANEYEAVLPASGCLSRIKWYVSVQAESGGTIYDPAGAPSIVYSVVVATGMSAFFEDNFQTNQGWTESGSASAGRWQRGVPAGGGDRGDPPTDYDGSGQCFLTGNAYGDSDIDGGSTTLTSPTFDLNGLEASIRYARWYSNYWGATPYTDTMVVGISSDGGVNWTQVERIGPTADEQAAGGWYEHEFFVSDFVTPTSNIKIRFIASDLGDGSVVEAAVDAIAVTTFECVSFVCGDADGSLFVDIDDVVYLITHIFAGGPAPNPLEAGDVDCSGFVDIDDVVYLITNIFAGGPAPCADC